MVDNEIAGRCPGEHERKALAAVARARRKDEIATRLADFLRGLKDDPNASGDDVSDLSDILRAHIMGDEHRKDFL